MAYEPKLGRIPIRHLSPQQPENLWPAKAFVGEVVPFQATVFKEGHDAIGVDLLLTDPSGAQTVHRMSERDEGSDRWQTDALLDAPGDWSWSVQAWLDEWAAWLHVAEIKVPAGIDVQVTLAEGARLLARASTAAPDNKVLKDAAKTIASKSLAPAVRLGVATEHRVTEEIERQPLASLLTLSLPLTLRVERTRAGVGSWYEFFPRSEGAKRAKNGSWTSGTFRTAARRLPAVAGMGFDVVYLPPIHPIGTSFRKGPNNSTEAAPGDPGSPWAIGSKDGGHDAIHPELGTVEDFTAFLDTAKKSGLEVALDLALQCSPDHPWVIEHPQWFSHLPDGSIAYAENPPKKYQDIYPLNFDNDPIGLREEILRIVRYWIGLGVKIFRVDNPHTKPLKFWEWLLHEVNADYPEVVFLAEAFTRPPMMHALAQLGFQQSYTYFTWRNTKEELADYLVELSQGSSDFLRPNLFVNTPDILSEYLQFGGPAAYKVRAAIASTASPSWGVYSGYELFEDVARQGSEENVDNEKYEFKPRDFAAAEAAGRSLAPYLGTLNRIRAEHPALRQLRNLELHWSDDDSILVYSKFLDGRHVRSGRNDAVIVVANVDPHSVRETTVHLDLTRIGLDVGTTFEVTDLITKQKFEWGADNYVRLDAFTEPVHILRVEFPKGR
ncbi:alpha-1,4-glucan--maltose-1-phosphate maltosyltransferase [Parafrigoribacterium humi]|uniref:alpha-1,4-glucan--maltose-1-phosphate maltosyltransferase n=1 Tax=Parafrigoribacterium humi TaxID=3144664 RepID=UPI0032EAF6E3